MSHKSPCWYTHDVPYGHIKPSAVAIRFKYGHSVAVAIGFGMNSMCSNPFDAFPETICAYEIVCDASASSHAFSSIIVAAVVGGGCDGRKLLGTNSGASTDKYDDNGIEFVVFGCDDDEGVPSGPSLTALVSAESICDTCTSLDSGCK